MGWFPSEDEIYLGATPSNPNFRDVVPKECGDRPVPGNIEELMLREWAARSKRIAEGTATMADLLLARFVDPQLRRR